MDGVPVKISEKYKPPPKITIPQTIINRLNSEGYPPEIFDYDFSLEKNVISKLDEWKKVREIENINRQSRLQEREKECARKLEEQQKQLLTSVFYPNADEISSGDDENESEDNSIAITNNTSPEIKSNIDTIAIQQNNTCDIVKTENLTKQAFNQPNFDTILMPTVLPDTNKIYSISNNIMDSSSSLYKNNLVNKSLCDKINYSDFENDTSSPFDSVELKTINDLDILAQVYNIPQQQQTHSIDTKVSSGQENNLSNNQSKQQINNIGNIDNKMENNLVNNTSLHNHSLSPNLWQQNNNTNIPITNPTTQQPIQNHLYNYNQQNYVNGSLTNQQTHNLYSDNNYYNTSGGTSYGNTAAINQNYQFLTNYNFPNTDSFQRNYNYSNSDSIPTSSPNYTNYMNVNNHLNYNYNNYTPINVHPSTTSPNIVTCGSPINQGNIDIRYASQYQSSIPNRVYDNFDNSALNANNFDLKTLELTDDSAIEQSIRNKSKSVPDILKELDNEIKNSESRRARNHSQTLEDYSEKMKQKAPEASNTPKLPSSFLNLTKSSQDLIKNISSMGFPIERVAKVAEKLGTDDKKIFEHLIPLSELLDLGFEEEKISEALLKFDNNKDKALDYLIS